MTLLYSKPNDVYHILAITVRQARFTVIDTYKFKKGHVVHGIELSDMSQYKDWGNSQALMLILAYYNGSKLREFTFVVDRKIEGQSERKLHHCMNF